MKKLLLSLLLIAPLAVFAQWHVGVTAGASCANYQFASPWHEATHTGYTAGLLALYQPHRHSGFAPGLRYIQKGYFHKICNTVWDRLTVDYVEIPLMYNYSFNILQSGKIKGHFLLGGFGAYALSGKYKMKGYDRTTESLDFKKQNFDRFDAGAAAGMRIEYALKKGSLSLDAHYDWGLLKLQKSAGSGTSRALVIGVTYWKLMY